MSFPGWYQAESLAHMCTVPQAIHQGNRGPCQPSLADAKDTAKEAGSLTTSVEDKSPEGPLQGMSDHLLGITLADMSLDLSEKTPEDNDVIIANLIAKWPNDIPAPQYIVMNDTIVIPEDIPPGYWAKLANKCVWKLRAVKRPGTLLFLLAVLPLCREPVLKLAYGGQTAGYQDGPGFSNAVAVKRENMEALLAHAVGQLAVDPCTHCRVGDGRFCSMCHCHNRQ